MKIFVTGASGYIGGSVAEALVAAGHSVRGLIRNPDRTAELRAFGIEPVIGTLADSALLEDEARAADAVVNAASSDDADAVDALLAGLRGSGKRFIHTSGSSIISDKAVGEASDAIFTETTPFVTVPEKAPRVAIDDTIRAAAPSVHSVVLCNSLIYGNSVGPKAQTVQVPLLVDQARQSKVVRHVGRGLNRWSNVHIADVTALYLLALERAPAGSFYFVENGEASLSEMTDAIGEALGLGRGEDWAVEEAISHWGQGVAVLALGSNSRVRADKARAELGWSPAHNSVTSYILNEMPR